MAETIDQPIVGGQTTAQNEAVETVLKRLEEGELFVPAYQRDSDEWDENKKSLFIESILNRLTVPAFYLAPSEDDPDRFEVVDGQQRLTTLASFFGKEFRLEPDEDCPYFGTSVQYAGLTYEEIHENWQKAFRRYNLTPCDATARHAAQPPAGNLSPNKRPNKRRWHAVEWTGY